MSRRRERGLEVSWRSTFDFVHSASFAPILALSLVMMLLYLAWLYGAQFLFFGLFGDDPPVSASDFVTQLFTTRRGTGLIFYGFLRVHICLHCALNFGGRLSVAPGQTGKRAMRSPFRSEQ
jgi:uncharacterized membrane protein